MAGEINGVPEATREAVTGIGKIAVTGPPEGDPEMDAGHRTVPKDQENESTGRDPVVHQRIDREAEEEVEAVVSLKSRDHAHAQPENPISPARHKSPI